ncbi:MAG: Cobalt-precorrin-5B C(1)-methyltransferase [Methanothrix sp.]|jgi:cobalt-precorrin-5B (C1)-methyltransferase|nr:MAG: Cobalt-precorrin-5B C(1)-methyltransferase [Methanothrix sp.]
MEEKSSEEGRGGVIDPVSGLAIPSCWIERSADPQVLEKVKSGLWALLSDGTLLRRGLTTGTTASAAAKGAVISLEEPVDEVAVLTPAGIRVAVPVEGRGGYCTAVKIGGDHDSDVTAGAMMEARATRVIGEIDAGGKIGSENGSGRPSEFNWAGEGIEIAAGPGIGRIGRQGLCAPLGKPAISPSARGEIARAIEEGMAAAGIGAVRVVLSVRDGEKIAEETMNPDVGVVGGISILGSTGFVEPWNEHLAESREAEILVPDRVVVTTGRVGLKYSRFLFPGHIAVLAGNRLDRIRFRDDQESVLCGLPALILKWGKPDILEGTGYGTVAEMVDKEPEHPRIDEGLRKVRGKLPRTRIVLLNRDGSILRDVVP